MARMFSTGLCGWCDEPGGCGRCFYTACCGPCAFGDNVQKLAPQEVPCYGGNCCGACCCYCLLGGFIPNIASGILGVPVPISFACCYHTPVRRAIRNKYGIPGDGCNDCLVTTFCAPCAICQEGRELALQGAPPYGFQTQAVFGAPQPMMMAAGPPGVVMAPPGGAVYVQ